ncbi:MAG: hypothetical protein PUC88_06360 [Clostridia bacterium]|nr:hypothetical protein [Clostridia bacterium]
MKNKKSTSEKINLIFSAFLIFAFIICTYFIGSYSTSIANDVLRNAVPVILFIVFGLFLFYATRVGDGKPVYRVSAAVLLLIVCPSLYILLAYLLEALPLHEQIATYGDTMTKIAAVALGYGLPYSFVSGFELACDNAEELVEEDMVQDVEESAQDTSAEEEEKTISEYDTEESDAEDANSTDSTENESEETEK